MKKKRRERQKIEVGSKIFLPGGEVSLESIDVIPLGNYFSTVQKSVPQGLEAGFDDEPLLRGILYALGLGPSVAGRPQYSGGEKLFR